MKHRRCTAAALGLMIGLALTACTGGGESGRTSSPSTLGDDWNVSQAKLDAAYKTFVDGLPERYGLSEPVKATFVRFVGATEWGTVQAECIRGKGFPAGANPQGGVTFGDIPKEQGPAQKKAAAECEASYPIDPRFNMKLPRKRAEAQYDFLVGTVAPCVEKAGYSVSKPPSRATWLDRYYTGTGAWDPFIEAAEQIGSDSAALDELYRSCPPISDRVYPPLSQ